MHAHAKAMLKGNLLDRNGNMRGPAETDMSAIGRAYGDDLVRMAAQIAVPGLMAENEA